MEMNGMKLRRMWFVVALAGVLVATQVSAQETGNVPETKAPAPTQTAPAAAAATPTQASYAQAAPAHMTRDEQLTNALQGGG
jgi:hypothetical protein